LQPDRKPTRVLIVDDHAMFRQGLRLLIESCRSDELEPRPQFEVVGEAGNRADALALAAREQPDVILLDLILQDEDGLESLPELLGAARGARVLVLTGVSGAEEHYRAVRLGAMGVVTKMQAPEVLFRAIESVCAGEVWIEPSMTVRILSEMLHNPEARKQDPEAEKIARLTARERGVITLVGDGLRNKQIADRLNISEVTVRHHLTSIFSKLKVRDRLGLALYAYRYGLAKPPLEVSGQPARGVRKNELLRANH